MTYGIVVAKQNSNRFKNKNITTLNGYPLFWHSVKPLIDSNKVDKIFVATNSDFIKDYAEKNGVDVIWRGPNISSDNDSLFKVLKYVYNSLNEKYKVCVSIMANCPGNTSSDIDKSIEVLIKNDLNEVRSFNKENIENGIITFNTRVFEEYDKISAYMGSITTDAKEIHYKKELDEFKRKD
jgi:CMP-N-acetylneuraminic acid synthetase